MLPQFAKDLPAGSTNRVERVAVVGAGGQIGEHFARALLATGKHKVTALTRAGSKNKLPSGVTPVTVDYDDHNSIVEALRGQEFLIITMAATAPPEIQSRIIKAAAEAGVTHIMPNAFGLDDSNETLMRNSPLSSDAKRQFEEIEAAGCTWTSMICSLWYEYSLIMGPIWFGFDFAQKKLTYYDDGTTKVNLTTWEQCARAVAAFLSLPRLPQDEADTSLTMARWHNKPLVISSFLINQKDMFESWKRVSGDTDADWTIETESSKVRYENGMQAMKSASDPLSARMGAASASFVRVFFPNGGGDYESTRGLDNATLGLPVEDLDERTAVAKGMLEEQYSAKIFARLTQGS